MFTFLLIVHAIIAAALVTVILMQRSEGGGLGMGGSPSGLMSARGAADFLTRATTILATIFVLMSIGLAVLATVARAPSAIDPSLARPAGPAATVAPTVPLAGDPAGADPLAAAAGALSNGAAAITDTPVVPEPTRVRADPSGAELPPAPVPAARDVPRGVVERTPAATPPAPRTNVPVARPVAPAPAPVADPAPAPTTIIPTPPAATLPPGNAQ